MKREGYSFQDHNYHTGQDDKWQGIQEANIKDAFNGIAQKYDLMNQIISLGLARAWRRYAVERAELRFGEKALDVCCGTGMLLRELGRKTGPSGEVVGLDISPRMLEVAREHLNGFPVHARWSLVEGSARQLPFADCSFDAVTVGWGLRNIFTCRQALQEILRVTRPGGKVVILEMGKPGFPLFKQVYWWALGNLVPLLGGVVTGSAEMYRYFYHSTRSFLSPVQLVKLLNEEGMEHIGCISLAWGAVILLEGRKPENSQ